MTPSEREFNSYRCWTYPGWGKNWVSVIHGFTGSVESIKPWAQFLNNQGYSVIAPSLPGHGSKWEDLNETTWQDWFKAVALMGAVV